MKLCSPNPFGLIQSNLFFILPVKAYIGWGSLLWVAELGYGTRGNWVVRFCPVTINTEKLNAASQAKYNIIITIIAIDDIYTISYVSKRNEIYLSSSVRHFIKYLDKNFTRI
jgi:hypothetical protein